MFKEYLKIAQPEVIKDGLTFWVDGHDFDNSIPTTTLRDRSGLGNDGACTNFANTPTSGARADSGIFIGGDDTITITDAPSLSSDYLTCEAKVHIGAAYSALTATILAKDDNSATPWRFGITGTGGVIIFIGAGVIMYSSVIPLNTTVHIAWTYDGTDSIIYFDGEVDNSEEHILGVLPQTTDPFYVGNVGTNLRPLDNTIYFARLYNRALTPTEIYQNYVASKNNS